MTLTKQEIRDRIKSWLEAWNQHNLERVMSLIHDDIVFENWTGQIIRGKQALHRAWTPWFLRHGDFLFYEEDIFIDGQAQKALLRWRLEWPSREEIFKNKKEIRRGVDLLHFREEKIHEKMSYSKTSIEIDGYIVLLNAAS